MSDRPVVGITGATSGIGRAAVRAFATRGYDVGLVARGEDALDAACREVREVGGRAVAVSADVADPDAVDRAVEEIEAGLGPIDVWVNDAMTSVFSPFREMTAEEFRRVTEVTYLGYVYATHAVLRRMVPRDHGVIVQVGSALAYRGIPLQSAYCGAKHAIQGFTEALRSELYHDGVHVRLAMVQMPAVNTPQFDVCLSRLPRRSQPVPPIYQPEVAADAVVFAAEHDRTEIWVGWPTVKTVIGNRIAPRLLDRYLATKGYAGQQTDEPDRHDRPSDLWAPVPGDRGAHGRFDRRSRARSVQLWATMHRGALALSSAAGAAMLYALTRRRGS